MTLTRRLTGTSPLTADELALIAVALGVTPRDIVAEAQAAEPAA